MKYGAHDGLLGEKKKTKKYRAIMIKVFITKPVIEFEKLLGHDSLVKPMVQTIIKLLCQYDFINM